MRQPGTGSQQKQVPNKTGEPSADGPSLPSDLVRYPPALQRGGDTRDHRAPITERRLTEQAHARIPWRGLAFECPAPVRRERHQDPDGAARGGGEMRRRSVDRDQEVAQRQYRRGIVEIGKRAADMGQTRLRGKLCCVVAAQLALDADEACRHCQ